MDAHAAGWHDRDRHPKKTSEYLQVMSDLKVLLRDYYGFHWHRSQVELARFHERCKADELELKTARTKQDLFDHQISELQSKIIETR